MKSNYFNNQKAAAMENFLNADWDGSDLEFEGQQILNAEGGNADISASQPYVVRTQNTTTADVSNVIILYATVKQSSYATSGISYTYVSNTTIGYGGFLAQIATGLTFEVGQMLLKASNASSSTTAQDQVMTSVTVTTYDINGNSFVRPLFPVLDSYQQITTQVVIRTPFLVNGLTAVTFGTIYGSTTLDTYIYPKKKVNQFGQLNNGAVTDYKAPNITPALGK